MSPFPRDVPRGRTLASYQTSTTPATAVDTPLSQCHALLGPTQYSVQVATHTVTVYIQLKGGRQAGREGARRDEGWEGEGARGGWEGMRKRRCEGGSGGRDRVREREDRGSERASEGAMEWGARERGRLQGRSLRRTLACT